MNELPAPLVQAEVDLRDFPFTPIFRARLFGSSFHARMGDAQWRAGVTLWLKSWDQVPAGTLPDDDIDLCRLAELGRDLKAWKRVKEGALHGWRKCADGRLHHQVVAEGVLEAWAKRSAAKKRGGAGAAARWSKQPEPVANPSETDGASIEQAMLGDGKGSRSEGREKEKGEEKQRPSRFALPDWVPPEPWAGWVEMRAKKRIPNTERALNLALGKLEELRKAGQNVAAVIDQSTTRGWTTFYPVKANGQAQSGDAQKAVREQAARELFGEPHAAG